jgi:AraC family transcriptional regulator
VSAISRTVDAIFHAWLPASGYRHAWSSGSLSEDALAFFEQYGEDFNPATGRGNIEVWVPVKES